MTDKVNGTITVIADTPFIFRETERLWICNYVRHARGPNSSGRFSALFRGKTGR